MHRVLKTLVQQPAVHNNGIVEPQLPEIIRKFAIQVDIPEEILCRGFWKQTWYLWARAAYLRLRFKKKQVNQGDFKIIFLLGEKTSKIQQHPLSLRDNLTPSVLHLQRQPPNP